MTMSTRNHSGQAARITEVRSNSEITALAERICDVTRDAILLVATVRSQTGRPVLDLDAVATQAGSDVEVYLVATPRASQSLTDLLEARKVPNVYGGAIRVYARHFGTLRTDYATHPITFVYPEEDIRIAERRVLSALRDAVERLDPRLVARTTERAASGLTASIPMPSAWAALAAKVDNDPTAAGTAVSIPATPPVPAPAPIPAAPAAPTPVPKPGPAIKPGPAVAAARTVPAQTPTVHTPSAPTVITPDPADTARIAELERQNARLTARLEERGNEIKNLGEKHATALADLRASYGPQPETTAVRTQKIQSRLEGIIADLRADVRDADARARAEAATVATLRSELAKSRRQTTTATAAATEQDGSRYELPVVYNDPEKQFRFEIEQTWLRTYNETDRAAYPLRDYTLGVDFLATVDTVNVSRRKVLDVAVQVITRRAGEVPAREVRRFSICAGSGSDQRVRVEDSAVAWRANITHRTPQAARFLWWELADGTVELAKAALHDDMVIR